MTGKRKRGEAPSLNIQHSGVDPASNSKPISAIAAARLKVTTPILDPSLDVHADESLKLEAEVHVSDYAESDSEHDVPDVPKNFRLCTWRDIGNNVLSDTEEQLTVSLEKHSTISFLGCFNVVVLKGAININGANLGVVRRQGGKARAHCVFVPATHPITKVRGLDNMNQVQFSNCNEPTPFASISPLFADIWNGDSGKGKRSFSLIQDSDADPLKRPLTPENAPEDWLRAIEEIATTPSVTFVTGSSLSGKSTFARRLVNRYLTGLGKSAKAIPSVCYLDLDPSRPEYTPHGQVSLTIVRETNLGPSFTHGATGIRVEGSDELIAAHPFPVRGLKSYEDYFSYCVEDLLQSYQNVNEDSTPPLIINTPTSLYTYHFDILQNLLTTLKPNHVIHLGSPVAIEEEIASKLHILSTLSSKAGFKMHEISAQVPLFPAARTDAELRAMHMQSYFHTASPKASPANPNSPQRSWQPNPLSTMIPWEFSYEETDTKTQDMIGFMPLFEPLPPSQLFTAINGSIIHIIHTSSPATSSLYQNLPRTNKYRIPYFPPSSASGMIEPPDPRTSRLVCTALIRGFDPEQRVVQVLVPKTHERLLRTLEPEKTVFVAGCCDTPEWAYMEDTYHQLTERKRNHESVYRGNGDNALVEGIPLPPWVAKKSTIEGMGYINTVRRVRKFLG